LLDVLKRQKQLLGIELLRTPAELCALQLAQEMAMDVPPWPSPEVTKAGSEIIR
jgi:hypothetical protein